MNKKEKDKYSQEIDWEFVKHTIAIVTRSFVKANEIIEILKYEGIFKKKRRKVNG